MFELFREAGLYDKLGQVDIGALIDSVARVFEIEGLRGGSLEVTHGSNLRYIDLNGLDSSYDSEEGTCWGVEKWVHPRGGYPVFVEPNGEISQWSFPFTVKGEASMCINGCDSQFLRFG